MLRFFIMYEETLCTKKFLLTKIIFSIRFKASKLGLGPFPLFVKRRLQYCCVFMRHHHFQYRYFSLSANHEKCFKTFGHDYPYLKQWHFELFPKSGILEP
jgi:hypothetical protein